MKKYKLYDTEAEWVTKNASLETILGIPDGHGTLRYAEILQVGNAENADFGKYIMPVCMDGTWKCDDEFTASDLVPFDPTWNLPPDPPEE